MDAEGVEALPMSLHHRLDVVGAAALEGLADEERAGAGVVERVVVPEREAERAGDCIEAVVREPRPDVA